MWQEITRQIESDFNASIGAHLLWRKELFWAVTDFSTPPAKPLRSLDRLGMAAGMKFENIVRNPGIQLDIAVVSKTVIARRLKRLLFQ